MGSRAEPDPVPGLKEKRGKKRAEEGYKKFYSYRHPAGGWAELHLLKPCQSSASSACSVAEGLV